MTHRLKLFLIFIYVLSVTGCNRTVNYHDMYDSLKEKGFKMNVGGVEPENPLYIYNDNDLEITVRVHDKQIIALKIMNNLDVYAFSVLDENVEKFSLNEDYVFNSEIEKYQLNQYSTYNSNMDAFEDALKSIGYSKSEFLGFCNWYYNEFHGTSFKDAFTVSHYSEMELSMKNSGYKLSIEQGRENNEILNISHNKHPDYKQLFMISISLQQDGDKYITAALNLSMFRYSNNSKEFYEVGENDVQVDIKLLDDTLRDIGYSKEEFIGFAEWYIENK